MGLVVMMDISGLLMGKRKVFRIFGSELLLTTGVSFSWGLVSKKFFWDNYVVALR